MLISVYVPFVITAVLTLIAPRLARRLTPRPAAWALACIALVTAVGWTGSLALLAFTGIAQIPEVAAEGHWSVTALRAEDPVDVVVAAVSALVLAASVVSLGVAALRQVQQIVRAKRECAALRGDTELAVVDDAAPLAFALPGAPGRIVVSRGMLRCLGDDEREALLAHERTHLRGRHHLFLSLWRLTTALNPLLRPLADTGAFVLERWADEEAAVRVGDRAVVARAVGRAALASAGAPRPALAVTGGEVPQRVRALLAPPPARRSLPFLANALLLAVCCACLANAASDSDRMVDSAKRAQCAALAGTTSAWPPGDHRHRHGPGSYCHPHHRGERAGHRPWAAAAS
ncbi:peptidase M48 Ste24p [Streptomyces pluripotens]|uniref:Peptidase M48 Ste24p n=1 Tax=Streptomyces pluripotens TaxID=1355015 RepID=A0A221P0P5_9ACTN|nr:MULTISPECIES: M56 family metallopeptidase [Streptomyces]ARP71529.1 peptidase M48 Ste24p [Streptomyces pluripotens]ASN25780.1 peptidase M48 Ste24p [Streptomyces pluripotens]MCH0557447.1 M56 family metallopeptidase [Streptomyces sp. MUM 16J]